MTRHIKSVAQHSSQPTLSPGSSDQLFTQAFSSLTDFFQADLPNDLAPQKKKKITFLL